MFKSYNPSLVRVSQFDPQIFGMLTMQGSWLFFVSLEILLTLKILDYATKSMVFPSIQLL
jgi:hypothetical protein